MANLLAQANSNIGGNVNTSQATTVVPPKISDPFNGKSILEVGLNLIDFLLAMIVIAAVIVIIIAGFKMITGGNNASTIASAKKAILWSVVGIAVAFMSFAIVAIIQNILN